MEVEAEKQINKLEFMRNVIWCLCPIKLLSKVFKKSGLTGGGGPLRALWMERSPGILLTLLELLLMGSYSRPRALCLMLARQPSSSLEQASVLRILRQL